MWDFDLFYGTVLTLKQKQAIGQVREQRSSKAIVLLLLTTTRVLAGMHMLTCIFIVIMQYTNYHYQSATSQSTGRARDGASAVPGACPGAIDIAPS